VAKNDSWFSPRRRLTLSSKEIFRSINFSRYAPYDPKVPTTTHIFDLGRWFYDNEVNANILKRKEREYMIKKMLSSSAHIVVPSFSTGSELVELWGVSEAKIDILPFLEMDPIEADERIFSRFHIDQPYFVHDSSYGNESNILPLIRAFGIYVHELQGKAMLVLHGNTGKMLTSLIEAIEHANIVDRVKIVGSLDASEQEALYAHADGWIAIGGYATSRTNIALALSKDLPLLLSDIRAFDMYVHAAKIHPNHLSELPHQLIVLEKSGQHAAAGGFPRIEESVIMGEYKRILAQGK